MESGGSWLTAAWATTILGRGSALIAGKGSAPEGTAGQAACVPRSSDPSAGAGASGLSPSSAIAARDPPARFAT